MATVEFTAIPAQVPATSIRGLAAATSTAEQALGKNAIFMINADEDITIRFGVPGFAAAANNTDYRIPAGTVQRWDVGTHYTSFKCFNLGGTAANIYIHFIARS